MSIFNLHNKVISYNDIKKILPDRAAFLDKKERATIDNIITNCKPLLFLPTYLYETHLQDVKYEKATYKIILMGVLLDGRKISVVLDKIKPYFEVKLKDGDKEFIKKQISDIIQILESNELTIPDDYSPMKFKPFKYYQKNKSWFLRLYYTKVKNRKLAIEELRKKKYETTTDDLNSYYRVVCRDYLTTFSSWAIITNYNTAELNNIKGDVIRVDIENYKAFNLELFSTRQNEKEELKRAHELDRNTDYRILFSDEFTSKYLENNKFVDIVKNNLSDVQKECQKIYEYLLKDKTLSCCWDIETWSKDGDIPQPDKKDDCVFCLSMTFQWVNDVEPFLKVCLCDYPANAKPGYLTIVCGTEYNIIKGFSEIFARLRPEFIFGFNDSDYDWNWIIKRAIQYKGLITTISNNLDSTIPYKSYSEDEIIKFNYKKECVKVEADTYVDGYSLMMIGYIPVDVRTVFRRLYPTAEQSSLKWFLAKNKLGGKEDMPYERLFSIYKRYREFMDARKQFIDCNFNLDTSNLLETDIKEYEQLKQDLADINYYCVIDAQRCHDLMKIRSVIMDHREVSNMAYVSAYDAWYRAKGMQVRNLTIAIGQQEPFCIRFTNISDGKKSDDQYPGAYVFPPKKGLCITKLNIEERINKAELTKSSDNKIFQEWLNTDKKEIEKFYNIIDKYGPILNDTDCKKIEDETEEKLHKKFKDFVKEPIGRPITGLDFSSLYPSLIRAYNFSPDYCILAGDKNKEGKKFAKELNDAGEKLTKVDFDFGKDNYGKPIRRLAYFVSHNNKYDPYIREENGDIKYVNDKPVYDPKFQFGVYPYILNSLFTKRAAIKGQKKLLDHRKEIIEAMPVEQQEKLIQEYNNIIFDINYQNSKQNALKVFMNTFYGEAGNQISPFFVLEVAGGITTYGQKNIIKAQNYVEEQGCSVFYGDTDSLYIAAPESVFKDLDRSFYCGKMCKNEYWTKMVESTMTTINNIRDGVNNMFINDNGTKFLSMAYEEVLYPVAFTAKKKYFGIAHENIPNFKPKDLFIRGLEVKKRGVSELLRKIFTELMWASCNMTNLYDLIELVTLKIDEIYSRKWDLSDFIQTGVYRPTRENVKINTFVKRMKYNGVDIKPNERFEYVIVKKYPYKYDIRGRKEELSIGDKIELVEIATKNDLDIDLDHYMQGSINGQLARLVTYHQMFHVEAFDDSKEELNTSEAKTYKNACKFIDDYCQRYYSKYNTFGKSLQKIYKTANKYVGVYVKNKDNLANQLLSANVSYDDFEEWLIGYAENNSLKLNKTHGKDYIEKLLAEKEKEIRASHYNVDTDKTVTDNTCAGKTGTNKTGTGKIDGDDKKEIEKKIKQEYKEVRKQELINLQKKYFGGNTSVLIVRENDFKNKLAILRKQIRDNHTEFVDLYKAYNNKLQNIIDIIKDKIDMKENLKKPVLESVEFKLEDFKFEINDKLELELKKKAEDDVNSLLQNTKVINILEKYKNLYNDLLAAHNIIHKTRSIVDYLKIKRDIMNRAIVRPSDDVIKQNIKRDMEESIDEINKLDI
jgi:DNA polymerase elongation subunit (family B)